MSTKKEQVQKRIDYLNRITHNSQKPWVKDSEGRLVASVGTYYLSGSEQGWQLFQMMSKSGAVNSVFDGRIYTLSELNEVIKAYIKGINANKNEE